MAYFLSGAPTRRIVDRAVKVDRVVPRSSLANASRSEYGELNTPTNDSGGVPSFVLRQPSRRSVVFLYIVVGGQGSGVFFFQEQGLAVFRSLEVLRVPEDIVRSRRQVSSCSSTRLANSNKRSKVLAAKYFVENRTDQVDVLVADLHEHAARVSQQLPCRY